MKLKHAPIGTKVQFGVAGDFVNGRDLNWIKVREDNTFIARTTDLVGCFDFIEPTNTSRDRRRNGNNYYPHSNINQWLNSAGNDWYVPQHAYDESPFYSKNRGFLSCLSPLERTVLKPHKFPIQVPLGSKKEFGKITEMEAKVWLPSASNLGYMSGENSAEDSEYVFPEQIRVDLIRYAGYGVIMTRTPYQDAGHIKVAKNYIVRKTSCSDSAYVLPMIELDGDIELSSTCDCDLVYYFPEFQQTLSDKEMKLLFD